MAQSKNAKRQRPASECVAQAARTNRNKLNQARKRLAKRQYWLARGTRKNGKPVKGATPN